MQRRNLLVMVADREALGRLNESARALGELFDIHNLPFRQGPFAATLQVAKQKRAGLNERPRSSNI